MGTSRARVAGLVVLTAALLGLSASTALAGPASYTTVAPGEESHCANGNPAVNCNLYDGKQYVWMNGGPASSDLGGDGVYFFAVVAPSGQNDPNDGSSTLLSSDARGERQFTVSGGVVTYDGSTHTTAGGSLINLMPYADTPNPGGVYVLAVCRLGDVGTSPLPATVPRNQCKTDAFKVRTSTPVGTNVSSCFSGTKYRDDDKDGQRSPGEIGLAGWEIRIDATPGSDPSDDVVRTTDADGNWSWCEPDHESAGGTTTYAFAETQQTGWKQTGNTVDTSIVLGGAVATLASKAWSVQVPNDANASADGLDFGNIPQGVVSGAKYYDGNANGSFDALEVLLSGWKIVQGGDASAAITTGVGGTFSVTLDPGSYTFAEVQATNGWTQTGNTTDQTSTTGGASAALASKAYTVTIPNDQPSSVSNVYFGNVCRVSPGGHTLGFWSNKNGQSLETAADFTQLTAYALRNANGSDRDFVDTLAKNKTAYSSWVLAASATNMAYMLSAQLSATFLSVQHGFTDPSVVVDGTRTVAQELVYANSLLQAGGLTVGASALRTEQERVKNILDLINNGGSFVQPTPGTCPTPVFP